MFPGVIFVPWGQSCSLGSIVFPGVDRVPWGQSCSLGSFLSSGVNRVPWGHFCSLGSIVFPGVIFVLWGQSCFQASCLSSLDTFLPRTNHVMSSSAMNKNYHRKVRAGRPLEGAPRGISSFRLETSSNHVHHPFEAHGKAWCDRNDHRGWFETNIKPPGGSTSLASFACTSSYVKGGNEIVGSCGRWSYSTHVEVSLPSKSWPTEVSR